MKFKKRTIGLILLGAGLGCNAQQSILSTGAKATGLGGSQEYSIGQVSYTVQQGNSGSVSAGVQQAYEVSVLSEVKESEAIGLSMSTFPNPTAQSFVLNLGAHKLDNLSFELSDSEGKQLVVQKIAGLQTEIDIQKYQSAIFILKVWENHQIIKTFKIIKK